MRALLLLPLLLLWRLLLLLLLLRAGLLSRRLQSWNMDPKLLMMTVCLHRLGSLIRKGRC
jgi:hypothetical protein